MANAAYGLFTHALAPFGVLVQLDLRPAFAEINVAWLAARLAELKLGDKDTCQRRARADIGLYDELVQSYQEAVLLPV